MKSLRQQTKRGFTLIEVALVLAIAGLIFLMVFQIVPTVRGTQRDTVRNEDLGTVQAALMRWQNSHNGSLPNVKSKDKSTIEWTEWAGTETFDDTCKSNVACQFVRDYINTAVTGTDGTRTNSFTDPSGEFYNVIITSNASGASKNAGLLNSLAAVKWSGGGADSSSSDDSQYHSHLTTVDDGSGNTIGATIDTQEDGAFDDHVMYILPGTTCEEDHAVPSTRNNFSILYYTERSGVACRGTSS